MSEQVQENQATEGAAGPAKKGKSKLLLIIIIVLLLGGGGGGYYYWTTTSAAAAENENEAKDGKKSKDDEEGAADDEEESGKKSSKSNKTLKGVVPDDEEVKQIIELEPFIVNLADTDQARYLRMTVSLGIGEGEEEKENQNLFITRVRNAMLAVISNKSSEEVLSVEGKAKLRKELLRAARSAADEPEIHAIYITDFIVQL
ncbi:MAG: flagellar basal body-associated FliL family protein [Pyrinomonadaceae bacterium]